TQDARMRLFNLESKRIVNQVQVESSSILPHAAFSPIGKILALCLDNVVITDVKTGRTIRTLPIAGTDICFSPNGTYLAVAHGRTDPDSAVGSGVTVWNTRTWKPVVDFKTLGQNPMRVR